MRKKLSLLLVALMTMTVSAVAGTWKATSETKVAAESTYLDDALLTVKTVFATTLSEDKQEFGGQSFTHFVQVRNAAYPDATVPTGTEQAGSTSLSFAPKKDVYVTFFYRRQPKDGAYAVNDGKDMILYLGTTKQTPNTLKVEKETSDGNFAYVTKKVFLEKEKTYYASAKGTTIQLYGFIYEEPSQKEFSIKDFDFSNAQLEGVSTNSSFEGDLRAGAVITDPMNQVKLTVSASNTGTPNRFWTGPQLRVYGGTLTFQAPEDMKIKGIVFNAGKWDAGNTADVGTLEGVKWTGEYNKVVITIAANTQINSITVRTDEKTAYAVLADNILTFKYDKNMPVENAWDISKNKKQQPGWNGYYYTTVAFDDSFKDARPDSCFYWFANNNIKSFIGLANFNTSEVKTMEGMFNWANNLESINLAGFDTKNVENMTNMFNGCQKLASLDLSKFNTEKVKSMNSMFDNCKALKSLDLSSFNTAKVVTMERMFNNCDKLESIKFGDSFNTAVVTTMSQMFYNCASLKALDLSGFDTRNVTNIYKMFSGCKALETLNLSNFNTVSVSGWSMSGLFRDCAKLKSLDLSAFNTSNIYDMSHMFDGCAALETINLSSFDTQNVYYMNSMFNGCASLTKLDLSNFVTSQVNNMGHMFANCTKLAELNIDNFTTNNIDSWSSEDIYVIDEVDEDENPTAWHYEYSMGLNYMFKNCAALTKLNLLSMNTGNNSAAYNYMTNMFEGCAKLATIDVTDQFVCYNGTDMFKGCVALPDFDDKVTDWNGIEPYCNVYAIELSTYLAAGRYMTYFTDKAVKVKGEVGKLYTITGVSETEVEVKELAVAAAKTPMLIQNNTEKDATVVLFRALKSDKATEVTKYPGFEGTLTWRSMPASSDDLSYYVLNDNNYFVKVGSQGTVYDNRCWLEIETTNVAAAPQLAIVDELTNNNTTGINTVNAANLKSAEIFDMQGRKVSKAQKGMYILNGKKVVVK